MQSQPLEQIPDEHKPNDEWIAARLKIKHEFRTRLVTGVQRKMKRRLKNGSRTPGDEVWMHLKPDAEELRKWRLKTKASFEAEQDESDTPGEKELAEETEPSGDLADISSQEEASGPEVSASAGSLPSAEAQDTWLGAHPALKKETSSDKIDPRSHGNEGKRSNNG